MNFTRVSIIVLFEQPIHCIPQISLILFLDDKRIMHRQDRNTLFRKFFKYLQCNDRIFILKSHATITSKIFLNGFMMFFYLIN